MADREQLATLADLLRVTADQQRSSAVVLSVPSGTYALDELALKPTEDGYLLVLIGKNKVDPCQT